MGNIPEEVLLALAAKNSGGGSGGTSNYEDLENKPKINGETLSGNKSASDLGLATDDAVQGILDGQSIDSFSDVESALADKVDKVAGKVLSTNDYTDADKAIVGGVTAALAGKQNVLTAGDYIDIDGNEISVNPVVPNEEATYQIVSDGQEGGTYFVRINKIVDGEVVLTERYSTVDNVKRTFDDTIRIDYANTVGWNFTYELLVASTTHDAGYTYSWGYSAQVDIDEVVVTADHSGESLVLKAQMDTALSGKQNTLTFDSVPTDGSTNPVESNGVYDALALKQDKTDNTLQTTDKTVVGAVNELKSGFTNLDNEVNGDATTYPYADVITIPDAIPSNLADCNVKIEPVQDLHGYDHPWVGGAGKNKLPFTVDIVKSLNGGGTWTGNTYNFRDVDFTVNTDSDGNVTSVKVNGTASQNVTLLLNFVGTASTEYYIGGCPNGGGNTYYFDTFSDGVPRTADYGSGKTFTADGNSQYVRIGVQQRYNAQNLMFYPMICLASETDKSFSPYTNICPISGHTEASVQRVGKNLYSGGEAGMINQGTGEDEPSGTVTRSYFINVGSSNSIALSHFDATSSGVRVFYYGKNKVYMTSQVFNFDANNSIIVSRPNGCEWIRFQAGIAVYLPTSSIQVELGSSATPYEPFKGKTYTIALGSTIYGGTVDFNTGVCTVNKAFVELDASVDEEWTAGSVNERAVFRCDNCTENHDNYYGSHSQWLSNIAVAIDSDSSMSSYTGQPNDWLIRGQGDISKNILVGTPLANKDMTLSDFKTMISTTPLQISYPLATPIELQLTPAQLELLKGTNTITASTGQISVTVNGVSGAIGSIQEQVNELAKQLPNAPTTDGVYTLTVTVADGTPTYSWESAT